MIISGDAAVFRSADEWYELERSGEKPNTVRIMTTDEYHALIEAAPTLIGIRHTSGDREFTRRIRSIYNISGVVGDRLGDDELLVEICWHHVLTLGERDAAVRP